MIDLEQLKTELPLKWWTPEKWVGQVFTNPLPLLNDHAHLEKKAALNALELLTRWPAPCPPENWVKVLTAIARDEVEHLALVVRLIARRGGELTRTHRNEYASTLRKLVRLGEGQVELMDRLMVSALVEARSCERFALLGKLCPDEELAQVYADLYACEAGHYRIFINLARELPGVAKQVDERWAHILDAEAGLVQQQSTGPTMHSGVA